MKAKESPLISIVTVCYNEEKNIEKTCKSISAQTLRGFEWIIIDGKSKDNTVEIISKYKNKLSVLISEKDNGIYNAMNKGISKANGEYLLFLNGGDMLKDKNTLERISNFIKEDKEKGDIYYGDLIYDNGEIVTFRKAKLNEKFFKTKTISHQATFIKKELFEKYGHYNERYKIVADFDFWVKTIIINKVKTKYLPIIISVFDLDGVSTNYKAAKKQIEERNRVLRKYGIINKYQAKLAKIKWLLLSILKKRGIYNFIRRSFRTVIKR